MSAGRFEHLVELQQPAVTPDGAGGGPETWSTIADGEVFAEIRRLSGGETYVAQQLQGLVTHRFTIRYRTGVTPTLRVLFEGRAFDIRDVIDWGERHVELTLICLERLAV